MYEYSEYIDPIWRYVEFIAINVGHDGVKCVPGTLDEEIEAVRTHLRELFKYFTVSENETFQFHEILDFDESSGPYKSQIRRLEICADRLGTYANLSSESRQAFFAKN
jgi:hypothetical protein